MSAVYRAGFNGVDMVDAKWYEVEEHHPHHQWETKMVLAMLRFGGYNAWANSYDELNVPWMAWQHSNAPELAQNGPFCSAHQGTCFCQL